MSAIDSAAKFSDDMLKTVRRELAAKIGEERLVVTCGSYARREASPSSDMDYYSIVDDTDDLNKDALADIVEAVISGHIEKPPSKEGAFATNISERELLENYGGSRDSNEAITRRMLYLLEGEFLTCESQFRSIRRKIIERYVANTPRDHQIAFYLLNDIVRYWRTLAVDYADKTYGVSKPKPWPVRNIKLIFSRKLIYASGLFSVALTADRMQSDKVDILEKLFDMTPLDRLEYVSGSSNVKRIREMYDLFLSMVGQADVRDHLDGLNVDNAKDDPQFRKLKNEGHYFSRELMGLFSKTFHHSHPVHMAVIF